MTRLNRQKEFKSVLSESRCKQIPPGQFEQLKIEETLLKAWGQQDYIITQSIQHLGIPQQNTLWTLIASQKPRHNRKIPLLDEEIRFLLGHLLLTGLGTRISFDQDQGFIYPWQIHYIFASVSQEVVTPEQFDDFRLGIAGQRQKGDGQNPFFSKILDFYIIPPALTGKGNIIIGIPSLFPQEPSRREASYSYLELLDMLLRTMRETAINIGPNTRRINPRNSLIIKPEPFFPDKDKPLIKFKGNSKARILRATI